VKLELDISVYDARLILDTLAAQAADLQRRIANADFVAHDPGFSRTERKIARDAVDGYGKVLAHTNQLRAKLAAAIPVKF
jgi:hypothetical protein